MFPLNSSMTVHLCCTNSWSKLVLAAIAPTLLCPGLSTLRGQQCFVQVSDDWRKNIQNCMFRSPMIGQCMSNCPIVGQCMSNCRIFGQCIFNCPVVQQCVSNCPMGGQWMSNCPIVGQCMSSCPMIYSVCPTVQWLDSGCPAVQWLDSAYSTVFNCPQWPQFILLLLLIFRLRVVLSCVTVWSLPNSRST